MTIQGADLVALFSGGFLESIDSPSAPTVSGTPTELDEELLDDVYEIIDEVGKTMTFWAFGSDDYSPATGKLTTGDPTQYNKKAVPPFEVNLRYVDGEVIRVGDMVSGLPAKNIEFTPAKGMKVTVGSDVWTIVRVSPIYSGERIALYLFQLRR